MFNEVIFRFIKIAGNVDNWRRWGISIPSARGQPDKETKF